MSKFIRIVTADGFLDTPAPDGAKSSQTSSSSWMEDIKEDLSLKDTTATSVSVDKLEEEMSVFLQNLSQIFDKAEQATKSEDKKAGLQLDEIELSIEINGEGEIKLWGLGGSKAGGKGAITLKFKRKNMSN